MKEFEGYDNLIWLTKCQFEKPYTTPMAYSASLIVQNGRDTNISCEVHVLVQVKKLGGGGGELVQITPLRCVSS